MTVKEDANIEKRCPWYVDDDVPLALSLSLSLSLFRSLTPYHVSRVPLHNACSSLVIRAFPFSVFPAPSGKPSPSYPSTRKVQVSVKYRRPWNITNVALAV